MRRAWLTLLLTGAGVLGMLCGPASALAGTYTWSLPNDFTTSGSGANPDHDTYGGTPWSYLESAPNPSGFTKLPTFSSGIEGGLTGWMDGNAFVAANPGGSPYLGVGPGELAMQPAASGVVAIGWKSPFNETRKVTVSSTVTAAPGTTPCTPSTTSGLVNQSGKGLSNGPVTLPAHGAIYLTLQHVGLPLFYVPACDTAVVTLQIRATGGPPAPTLHSPASGTVISGGQPTFAGAAGADFGDSPKLTVRVYRGASASGRPAQSINTTHGPDGSYSTGPKAPLADGRYTVRVEQDDILGEHGFSPAVTFELHNAAPTIALRSLGQKPLRSARPTIEGTAGTARGDAAKVYVGVFTGSPPSGHPIRVLAGSRSSDGHFSIRITPALPDGQYTVVVVQQGTSSAYGSARESFRIKVHPPALTLVDPVSGSSTRASRPTFSGAAGNAVGDSPNVTVSVWSGSSVSGPPLGSVTVKAKGALWSARWRKALPVGLYAVRARQSDDAGHTAQTPVHTFLIAPGPQLIGPTVTLDQSNAASISITCLAPTGVTCSGTVLVLTQRSFQPSAGGPSGPLRVLFAYITIAGGKTEVVSRPVPSQEAATLRRAAPLPVDVTVELSKSGGGSISASATGQLQAS